MRHMRSMLLAATVLSVATPSPATPPAGMPHTGNWLAEFIYTKDSPSDERAALFYVMAVADAYATLICTPANVT